MSAPRRLLDDPSADRELQRVLRESGGARPLDEMTRRRLRSKVSRAAALPALAAGWLFVKSAAAALGAVGVAATVATVTGVVDWPSSGASTAAPEAAPFAAPAKRVPRAVPAPQVVTLPPIEEPAPALKLNPSPSLPIATPSASGGASLAAESTLLEQARREMRRAPALALQIAGEHTQRFPRGQLASERTLIQVEALHRLGRDAEARTRAQGLLRGAAGDLYRERVRQLLGETGAP